MHLTTIELFISLQNGKRIPDYQGYANFVPCIILGTGRKKCEGDEIGLHIFQLKSHFYYSFVMENCRTKISL